MRKPIPTTFEPTPACPLPPPLHDGYAHATVSLIDDAGSRLIAADACDDAADACDDARALWRLRDAEVLRQPDPIIILNGRPFMLGTNSDQSFMVHPVRSFHTGVSRWHVYLRSNASCLLAIANRNPATQINRLLEKLYLTYSYFTGNPLAPHRSVNLTHKEKVSISTLLKSSGRLVPITEIPEKPAYTHRFDYHAEIKLRREAKLTVEGFIWHPHGNLNGVPGMDQINRDMNTQSMSLMATDAPYGRTDLSFPIYYAPNYAVHQQITALLKSQGREVRPIPLAADGYPVHRTWRTLNQREHSAVVHLGATPYLFVGPNNSDRYGFGFPSQAAREEALQILLDKFMLQPTWHDSPPDGY